MITITCKIPEEINGRLEAEARRRHIRKSDLIREALRRAIRPVRGAKAPRVHDLAKSLCGKLHGPGDLSSNPKYMEGFGA